MERRHRNRRYRLANEQEQHRRDHQKQREPRKEDPVPLQLNRSLAPVPDQRPSFGAIPDDEIDDAERTEERG